ncbi:hypothetical protein FBQ97_08000 [Acidobacteria bacterium ACD]|nr:MAG: hypothetical protein EDX89_03185 [Acidobacteriota bacterium]MCE7956665.1 hypothetical protein [Acidobacteria bacterium ACB2]MDL1949737.1 hypothetical protein [Acidobacteria bacterium ACD]
MRHRLVSIFTGRPAAPAVLAAALLASPAAAGDWTLAVEKQGVKVWTRQAQGVDVREVRAESTFDLPAPRILAMLADVGSYSRLMPLTDESRLLRRDGRAAWFYMVIDPPWLSHRDFCIRTWQWRREDGALVSEWATDEAGCPAPRPGMVRILRNEGRWTLTALDEGTTVVGYEALTDPGGNVPKWMVNMGTPGSLVNVFTALRKAAELPEYEAAARPEEER